MANTTANLLFSVSLLKPIRKKKTQTSWKGPTCPVSIVWVDRKGFGHKHVQLLALWHQCSNSQHFQTVPKAGEGTFMQDAHVASRKKLMSLEVFFKNI